MNDEARHTAVCYSNLAEACLYFDHIIPLGVFFDDTMTALPHVQNPEDLRTAPRVPRDFLLEIVPAHLRNTLYFTELGNLHNQGVEAFLQWAADVRDPKILTFIPTYFDDWLRNTRALTERMGVHKCPVITHPDFLPQALEVGVATTDFAATMTSLHLVDASRLSWDQIRGFRRDPRSRMKLRRLRLFFAQNYDGRDRQYIEDDLYRALDDYAATVKSWGFETRAQVVTMLLSSKWVAGAVTGSALSVILGAPVTAIVTSATGLALELGHIVVEVSKRKHAMRRLVDVSPISYVADLRTASRAEIDAKEDSR